MKYLCPILLLFAAGCSSKREDTTTTLRLDSIETILPQRMRPSRTITLPGDLKPWEVVSIQAKIKGYVKSVRADRGTRLRKGQLMATLEAPELQAQQAEARARTADARSKLMSSNLTYRRMLQTSKTPGAVAANELDLARSKAEMDSMQWLSTRASYEAISQMTNYLNIVSPFEGIITERNVSAGELVGPERSKPMFILENSEILRLTVGIPEIYSGQLGGSDTVTFRVTAFPELTFQARFSRSAQTLDFTLRSMATEFDVSNRAHLLKAGMYAEVMLPFKRTKETLFVPASAVVNSTERVFVIRVSEQKATWIEVKTGVQTNGWIEIFGPIKESERLVMKASEELRDGSEVIAKAFHSDSKQ